jgi:hypothetical protein
MNFLIHIEKQNFLLNAFKTRSKLYDKFNVESDYFLRRFNNIIHSINTQIKLIYITFSYNMLNH